ELLAVDGAVERGPGKRRFDKADRGPAMIHQVMDAGIGVVHRDAHLPQGRCGGGLPHADRAGQAEDDHGMSFSTKSLRAGVTWGSTPNQAAKPGRAWCSSMPSPSTTAFPRALAVASKGVSSGT